VKLQPGYLSKSRKTATISAQAGILEKMENFMSDCSHNLAVYFRIEFSAQIRCSGDGSFIKLNDAGTIISPVKCCRMGEFNRIAQARENFSRSNRLSCF